MKKLVLAVALVVAFAAPAMAQDFPQGYNQTR
jgi:opacity protein-like surface antigen